MTPLKGPRVLFAKKTNAETSTLKDVRNAILSALGGTDVGTDEYSHLLTELERVCKLMQEDKTTFSFKPSSDSILNAGMTVLSILLITKHEDLNVITSKAMSFLPKLIK